MATPAKERLNSLLKGKPRPNMSDPTNAHFVESEVREAGRLEDERARQIPNVSQYSQNVATHLNDGGHALDQLLNSDDEDESIAAFKSKPKGELEKPTSRHGWKGTRSPDNKSNAMSPYIPKGREMREGESSDSNESGRLSSGEPPTQDRDGNQATGHFCVFQMVAKFPYKYMEDTNDSVSRHYFAKNKFYDRKWDIYYINAPGSLMSKPILLLLYDQVKVLIDEIARTFQMELSIPPDPFTISFFEDSTPQPVFLGTSTSREQVGDLQASIPGVSENYGEPPTNSSPALVRSFAAYKSKCNRVLIANKTRNEATKKKKAKHRLLALQDELKQLKRAQCYFGLRPRSTEPPEPDPAVSWAEQEHFRKQQLKKCHVALDPLDINQEPPFPFDSDPIIISIDIESYERGHHLITEIGVSTLDTLDLYNLPPGEGGECWMKQIRSRHFRIRGREYLRNTEFCIGNPEAFDFGKSEFVTKEEAPAAVDACFEHPFSAGFRQLPQPGAPLFVAGVNVFRPTNADQEVANRAVASKLLGALQCESPPELNREKASRIVEAIADSHKVQKGPRERNILLVGHEIGTDLAYMNTLGSKIFSPSQDTNSKEIADNDAGKNAQSPMLPTIIEALDTATLYRIQKKEKQTRSLARVLADLGRCGWNLHNAGNDARYTLEVLIALIIKARLDDDVAYAKDVDASYVLGEGRQAEWEQVTRNTVEEKGDNARQEVVEECEPCKMAGIIGKTRRWTGLPEKEREAKGVNGRGVFATALPLLPKP